MSNEAANERPKKIAIVGAVGFTSSTSTHTVSSMPWSSLALGENLRDQDVLILNFLDGPPDVSDTDYRRALNAAVMHNILMHDGAIVVVGDARGNLENGTTPLLGWTGLGIEWIPGAGDTIKVNEKLRVISKYERLLERLRTWTYSIGEITENRAVLRTVFGEALVDGSMEGFRLRVEVAALATNRYNAKLAAVAQYCIDTLKKAYPSSNWVTLRYSGPIVFLPKLSLTTEETLSWILRDLYQVELETNPPDWTLKVIPPEAQHVIDGDLAKVRDDQRHLTLLQAELESARKKARGPVSLLYERGPALERTVRAALRELGATVTEASDPTREDGWVSVDIAGSTRQGVLEIKSTKADQFGEDGLRQLLEWIQRGIVDSQSKYKGIFIGNSAVERRTSERVNPFGANWTKSALISGVSALLSEDLYRALLLKERGELDCDRFWSTVFDSNGVTDFAYLRVAIPTLDVER